MRFGLGARALSRGSTIICTFLLAVLGGTLTRAATCGALWDGSAPTRILGAGRTRLSLVSRRCAAPHVSGSPRAAVTPAGKDLEQILVGAHTVADNHFSTIWNSLVQKGRDGGVPGLREWLSRLNLTDQVHAAVLWADRMGACDLAEIVENYDDFATDLGLDNGKNEASRHAQEVARGTDHRRQRHSMNAKEADESLLYLLLNWPEQQIPFEDFDDVFSATVESLRNSSSSFSPSLEESFSREMRERLKVDLQYLRVMREYFALHLPVPPSLDQNKTWTFCGGAQKWLDLAGDAASAVSLMPLTRPVRLAMERVVLGDVHGSRLLRTYVAAESGLIGLMSGHDGLLDVVNTSRQIVFKAVKSLAGASGLPDWNRSHSDGLVPLGIEKKRDGEQNKSEVALQLQKYFEIMGNTRVAQADRYFGHVLFGYLLSHLSQRFELVRNSGLLNLHPEVQRLKLVAQVRTRQDRFSKEELQTRLSDEVFEQFLRTSLNVETPLSDIAHLSPTAVQAIRRHTDQIFGKSLREEIFVPFTRASRESARKGHIAAGPEICTDCLLEAARNSELRMLSLSPAASERLLWHGLVFGALLQKHDLA